MKKKIILFLPVLLTLTLLLGSCNKEKSAFYADHLASFQEKKLVPSENSPSVQGNDFVSGYLEKSITDFIKTKSFYKKESNYIIDYRYPYLDSSNNPSFDVFNKFISEQYLNPDGSLKNTLNEQTLSCDIGYNKVERLKRLIDYKIYAAKGGILSVLLYKANHYMVEDQYSYLFKTLNFDLKKGTFISFDDVFKAGAELEVYEKINQSLVDKSNTEIYQECWQITPEIFKKYQNNFVVDDHSIKFYFDDCVICPVYSGTYFVEIPKQSVSDLLVANIPKTDI